MSKRFITVDEFHAGVWTQRQVEVYDPPEPTTDPWLASLPVPRWPGDRPAYLLTPTGVRPMTDDDQQRHDEAKRPATFEDCAHFFECARCGYDPIKDGPDAGGPVTDLTFEAQQAEATDVLRWAEDGPMTNQQPTPFTDQAQSLTLAAVDVMAGRGDPDQQRHDLRERIFQALTAHSMDVYAGVDDVLALVVPALEAAEERGRRTVPRTLARLNALRARVKKADAEIERLRAENAALRIDLANAKALWAIDMRSAYERGEALARVEALIPDECWVLRSSQVRCTEFLGGGARLGNAEFTEAMCCLPCRLRAALADTPAPGPSATDWTCRVHGIVCCQPSAEQDPDFTHTPRHSTPDSGSDATRCAECGGKTFWVNTAGRTTCDQGHIGDGA